MKIRTTGYELTNHWWLFECSMCGPLCILETWAMVRGVSDQHLAVMHNAHVPV